MVSVHSFVVWLLLTMPLVLRFRTPMRTHWFSMWRISWIRNGWKRNWAEANWLFPSLQERWGSLLWYRETKRSLLRKWSVKWQTRICTHYRRQIWSLSLNRDWLRRQNGWLRLTVHATDWLYRWLHRRLFIMSFRAVRRMLPPIVVSWRCSTIVGPRSPMRPSICFFSEMARSITVSLLLAGRM